MSEVQRYDATHMENGKLVSSEMVKASGYSALIAKHGQMGKDGLKLLDEIGAEHALRLAAERQVGELRTHLAACQYMLPQAEADCKALQAKLDTAMGLLRRCVLSVREQHCDEGEAEYDLPVTLLSEIDAFTTSTEVKDHE